MRIGHRRLGAGVKQREILRRCAPQDDNERQQRKTTAKDNSAKQWLEWELLLRLLGATNGERLRPTLTGQRWGTRKGNDNCKDYGFPQKSSRAYPGNPRKGDGSGYGKRKGDLAMGGGRVRIRRLGKQRGWSGSEEQ
jgi:hypothetical protein